MSKYTPGPWTVHEATHVDGEYWASIGQLTGHGPITDIVGEEGNHTEYFKIVAGMKHLVTDVDEQKANACLIAAAPSLLAALETMYHFYNPDGLETGPAEQARDAITQAHNRCNTS